MAVMTITTTAAQAQRVATAIGVRLRLGRDATQAEVKAEVIEFLRQVVINTEAQTAAKAAADAAAAFDPT